MSETEVDKLISSRDI